MEYNRLPDRSARPKPRQKGRLRNFFRSPKATLLFLLLLLIGIAGIWMNMKRNLYHAGVSVLAAVVIELVIMALLRRKPKFPDGAIITGLIVGLVLSSMNPWYWTAATSAIAVISKHTLKVKRFPMFNPAAFGLLAAIFLFSGVQDWWGGLSGLPAWCIAIVLIAGIRMTKKVNKSPQVLSFLGFYFILLLILDIKHIGVLSGLYRMPMINSVLFFAFFMLTDPPTSQAKVKNQVFFGFVTAVVSVAAYLYTGGLDFLLIGLLTANAWSASLHMLKSKKAEVSKVTRVT